MTWKSGQTGNPNGRPRKYIDLPEDRNENQNARNHYRAAFKRDDYRNIAAENGLEDPVLYQHKLLADESLPVGLRAQIAAAVAPYWSHDKARDSVIIGMVLSHR